MQLFNAAFLAAAAGSSNAFMFDMDDTNDNGIPDIFENEEALESKFVWPAQPIQVGDEAEAVETAAEVETAENKIAEAAADDEIAHEVPVMNMIFMNEALGLIDDDEETEDCSCLTGLQTETSYTASLGRTYDLPENYG